MGLHQARELWVRVQPLQVYGLKVQHVLLHLRRLNWQLARLGGEQALGCIGSAGLATSRCVSWEPGQESAL